MTDVSHSKSADDQQTDTKAEWVTVALLGIIGACGVWLIAIDFLNMGPDSGFLLQAAIVAAILFGIGVWAAFRIGGVLPVLVVLPLLLVAASPIISGDKRLSRLEALVGDISVPEVANTVSQLGEHIDRVEVQAVRANSRIDQVRITYPRGGSGEGPLLESSVRNFVREIAIDDPNSFCFFTSIEIQEQEAAGQFAVLQDYFRLRILPPEERTVRVQVHDGLGNDGNSQINARVLCVGLPGE